MWLAAAAAFNLVCSGTLSTDSFYKKDTEPFTLTLRVDLDRKKYCENECRALLDIQEVQPTSIKLKSENIDTPRERLFVDISVNRETGKYSGLSTSGFRQGILILKWDGQCERQGFTGFPEFQTKF
jgi:hypothetical protein